MVHRAAPTAATSCSTWRRSSTPLAVMQTRRAHRAGRRRGGRRSRRRRRRLRRAPLRARSCTRRSTPRGGRRGRDRRAARGERGGGGRPPISAHVICCAMRTADRSLEIAQLVDRMRGREPKVVAFDLAGAETGFPPSLHAEALAFARAAPPQRDDPRQRAARPRADRRRPRPRRPPHRPRRAPRPRHGARCRRPRRAAPRTARALRARPPDPPRAGADVQRADRRRRRASPSTRSARSSGPASPSA